MPRQRIINPEFWLDYEIASIENPNACLFYIGTWNFCDDYGVIENNAPKLKAQIFPYREVNVAELIDIFVKLGKFVLFEANGKSWIFVKNFLKFQKIKKPSQFRNPEYQEAKNEAKTEPVGKEWGTGGEPVGSESKTESKTKTKTKENSISCGAVAPRDDQDIVDIINAFSEVNPSYRKYFANTTQRAASGRLVKTHGKDKVLQVIAILPQTNKVPYAPVITTPAELENKFAALAVFFQRSQFKTQVEIPKTTIIR